MANIVVDTTVLIERLRNGTLREYLNEHRTKGNKLFIHFGVRDEMDSLIDDEQKMEYQQLLRVGLDDGLIVNSRHKYKLKEPYKTLFYNLSSYGVGLSTTDKHIVALKFQVDGEMETLDSGIIRVLSMIKTSSYVPKSL